MIISDLSYFEDASEAQSAVALYGSNDILYGGSTDIQAVTLQPGGYPLDGKVKYLVEALDFLCQQEGYDGWREAEGGCYEIK